jgi:hypothetical protein
MVEKELTQDEKREALLKRLEQDYLNSDKNKFKAIFDFDENRLKEVQQIDKLSYGEELGDAACASMEDYVAWLKANPDMYVGVVNKETDILEAYICFVPLKKETYKRFKAGEILDVDLDASDFTPFEKGVNDCLQMDVASREQKISRSAAITLIDAFKTRIKNLAKEGKYIGNVLYDICSQMGYDSANLISDMEKVGETHYEGVTNVAGMYEGRLKISKEIEKTLKTLPEKEPERY